MRDVLFETANESLPKKEKRAHKKWMTDDILKMMRERQKIRDRNSNEYKAMDRKIKEKCKETNVQFWKVTLGEIIHTDAMSGRKTSSAISSCIRAKDVASC